FARLAGIIYRRSRFVGGIFGFARDVTYSIIDGTDDIAHHVLDECLAVFVGQFVRQPAICRLLKFLFIVVKPLPEIVPVEYTSTQSKIADTTENGKQIWVIIRIDAGYPCLMIPLKQKSAQMAPGDIRIFKGQSRINHWSSYHFIRCDEVMIVMTVRTAEGNYRCNGCTAATGTAGA